MLLRNGYGLHRSGRSVLQCATGVRRGDVRASGARDPRLDHLPLPGRRGDPRGAVAAAAVLRGDFQGRDERGRPRDRRRSLAEGGDGGGRARVQVGRGSRRPLERDLRRPRRADPGPAHVHHRLSHRALAAVQAQAERPATGGPLRALHLPSGDRQRLLRAQ